MVSECLKLIVFHKWCCNLMPYLLWVDAESVGRIYGLILSEGISWGGLGGRVGVGGGSGGRV